jgi:hypothetical protein
VRLSTPVGYRFIAVPIAFDPQTLIIVRAAAVAVADRALILKCLLIHLKAGVYFFSSFNEAELMQ